LDECNQAIPNERQKYQVKNSLHLILVSFKNLQIDEEQRDFKEDQPFLSSMKEQRIGE
jgi:hypothetical protein